MVDRIEHADWVDGQAEHAQQVRDDLRLLERCFSVLGAYGLPACKRKRSAEEEQLGKDLNSRFGWDDSE